MKDNLIFYTASMAKLCADQGYFDKSLEIYRYLLEADFNNEALRQALTEVEAQLTAITRVAGAANDPLDRLEPMIKKWVGLMVEYDLKSKFDKIRKSANQFQLPDQKA